jgi:hypothetical protein
MTPIARFWIAYSLGAIGSLLVIFIPETLPSVDLLAHTALLRILRGLGEPSWPWASIYQINPFASYWASYGVGYCLSFFFSVETAARAVMALGVLLTPLSLRYLLRQTSGLTDFAPFGFALAMGFSFHWGLLSFTFALPFSFGVLGLIFKHDSEPTRRSGLMVAAGFVVLYACHLLALMVVGLAGGFLALSRLPDIRSVATRLAPLCMGVPIIGLWILTHPTVDPTYNTDLQWLLTPERLYIALAAQVGDYGPLFALAGTALLVLPLLVGVSWDRTERRLAPALAVLGCILLLPMTVYQVFGIFPRFCAYFAPLVWAAARPGSVRRPRLLAALSLVLPALWSGVLLKNALYLSEQISPAVRILETLPPGQELVKIEVIWRSPTIGPLPYSRHVSHRYQIEGDGLVVPGLARYRVNPIVLSPTALKGEIRRYLPTNDPSFMNKLDHPYDWLWLQSNEPLSADPASTCTLANHTDIWWLYACSDRAREAL